MIDTFQGFKNICEKEILQTNLTFMALYIGIFEHMADTVKGHVESLLCDDPYIDNNDKLRFKITDEYRKQIKNRPIDEDGNRDILKASMLWFVDMGAISEMEYEEFLELKKLRNSFAHEMHTHIWNGLYEEHAKAIGQLIDLYRKIEKWWINEVEIPISGEILPGKYDLDGVTSGALITFEMMINTLYADKSEEYMEILRDLRSAEKEKMK